MQRTKQPEEIRRDALRMACAKVDTGCFGCAEAYLVTARVHGASDDEIAPILQNLVSFTGGVGPTTGKALASVLARLGMPAENMP